MGAATDGAGSGGSAAAPPRSTHAHANDRPPPCRQLPIPTTAVPPAACCLAARRPAVLSAPRPPPPGRQCVGTGGFTGIPLARTPHPPGRHHRQRHVAEPSWQRTLFSSGTSRRVLPQLPSHVPPPNQLSPIPVSSLLWVDLQMWRRQKFQTSPEGPGWVDWSSSAKRGEGEPGWQGHAGPPPAPRPPPPFEAELASISNREFP